MSNNDITLDLLKDFYDKKETQLVLIAKVLFLEKKLDNNIKKQNSIKEDEEQRLNEYLPKSKNHKYYYNNIVSNELKKVVEDIKDIYTRLGKLESEKLLEEQKKDKIIKEFEQSKPQKKELLPIPSFSKNIKRLFIASAVFLIFMCVIGIPIMNGGLSFVFYFNMTLSIIFLGSALYLYIKNYVDIEKVKAKNKEIDDYNTNQFEKELEDYKIQLKELRKKCNSQ